MLGLWCRLIFQPIAPARAYQAIVSQIEQMIANGTLNDGDQLPGERDLAEQFGVSRVVIRESIRNLQARGMVEVRHGSGTFIRGKAGDILTQSLTLLLKLEEASLLDLYVVRQALEVVAAPRAAQYATAEDISGLRQSLDDMAEIIKKGIDVEEHFHELTRCDIDLHGRVAEASHNIPLATLLHAILPMIMSGRIEIINRTGGFKRFIARSSPQIVIEEHANIVSAIVNRDPTAAEHFIYKHLQRSMVTYRDLEG